MIIVIMLDQQILSYLTLLIIEEFRPPLDYVFVTHR